MTERKPRKANIEYTQFGYDILIVQSLVAYAQLAEMEDWGSSTPDETDLCVGAEGEVAAAMRNLEQL